MLAFRLVILTKDLQQQSPDLAGSPSLPNGADFWLVQLGSSSLKGFTGYLMILTAAHIAFQVARYVLIKNSHQPCDWYVLHHKRTMSPQVLIESTGGVPIIWSTYGSTFRGQRC
jgi:hypothetical protein